MIDFYESLSIMSRRRHGLAKIPKGDLLVLKSVRVKQTSAGAAMAALAYNGAGLHRQVREGGDVIHVGTKMNKDTGLPWTVDDLSLHLFNEKRESPDPDQAAEFNPDGSTLSNYLAGRKMPELGRIHLAVARMIQDGTLPEEAFHLVHAELGTHRAVQPFKDLLLDLEYSQKTTARQTALLGKILEWLQIGQKDFDRLLREDRIKFRKGQFELLDELLLARAHLRGNLVQSDKEFRKNLRWIYIRAKALLKACGTLRVSSVDQVPDYSQRAIKTCLRFLPVMRTADGLTFAPYLKIWLGASRTETEIAVFESIRQQVVKLWKVDIKPLTNVDCVNTLLDAEWLLETALLRDFGDLLAVESGTRVRDEVCIRRCIKWVGVDWTYTTALMASIREFYEVENQADSEELICRVLDAARLISTTAPADVSRRDVKQLIKLVRRLSIDVCTSLNLDVAEAVPLREQPWRIGAAGIFTE